MIKNIVIGLLAAILIYFVFFYKPTQPDPERIERLKDSVEVYKAGELKAKSKEDSVRSIMVVLAVKSDSTNKSNKKEIKRLKSDIAHVRARVDTVYLVGTPADTLIKKQDTTIQVLTNANIQLEQQLNQQSAQYEQRLAYMDTANTECNKQNQALYGIIGEQDKEIKKQKRGRLKDKIVAGGLGVLGWIARGLIRR